MRRLLVGLAAIVLMLGVFPLAASGSDRDDDARSGSSSGEDDSGRDGDDDSDEDDDAEDDDAEDDDAEDEDEGGGDGHQRRRRNRNRSGGGDEPAAGGRGGGGGGAPSPPASGPAPAAATVTVQDDAFSPATIRIAPGGTVTWDNVSREHTVTGDGFDSGVFGAGERYQRRFPNVGTFAYQCLIHSEMQGQVVVGDGPAAAASSGAAARDAASSSSGGGASSPGGAGTGASTAGAPTGGGSSGLPALAGSAAPAPVAAAAGPVDVAVVEFEFSPAHVEVSPGTTVRWMLDGTAPHTVTAETFDSGMLKPGDSYEQTFTDVGTVEYRCEFHPEMTGSVAVVEGRAAPPGGAAGAAAGSSGAVGAGAADDASSGAAPGTDDAAPASAGALADTGIRGWPGLLAALGIILLGWAALVTGKRRGRLRRRAA